MNDAELDQLLKTVGTPAITPVSFQRDVWFRIETEESNIWELHLNRILDRFLGFLTVPPVAVATCSAMIVVGVWFGTESGHSKPSDELTYVQSISPFAQSHR